MTDITADVTPEMLETCADYVFDTGVDSVVAHQLRMMAKALREEAAPSLTIELAQAMYHSPNRYCRYSWDELIDKEYWLDCATIALAHLTTAGRLVPAGGMALTAEQVEDVRTAREGLRGYRNFDGNARGRNRRLITAVDALFPATEPAEVDHPNHVCDLGCRVDCLFNGTRSGAPAEPAEEETKAEDESVWHWVQSAGGYYSGPACTGGYRCRSMAHYEGCLRPSLTASAPVVPAPTETEGGVIEVPDGRGIEVGEALKQIAAAQMAEVARKAETGPWQRIEDVPEGVLQIKDRHGRTWLMVGGTWRFEWHDGNWYEPHTNINAQAPFVAADEEG